jgi:hypothetical protein
LASAALIAAAYRYLVQRHDRDVAASRTGDGIERLSIARDPLTAGAARSESTAAAGESISAPAPPDADPTPVASSGINATEVNRFLADIRTLDHRRARQVWAGRAMAHAKGYTRAHGAAMAVAAQADRQVEWAFAHDAASLIARARLGKSPISEPVAEIMADLAGTFAIRDVIPQDDLDILLLPWNWRGAPIAERESWDPPLWSRADVPEPTPVAPTPPVLNPSAASVSAVRVARTGRRRGAALTSQPAIIAILALVVLVGTTLALNRPTRELGVGAFIHMPSPTSAPAVATPSPTASPRAASFEASASPTLVLLLTLAPTVLPVATVRPTPRPTPKPTPKPTPTPTPQCQVVNLVGLPSYKARSTWANAGFSGAVTFSPAIPPHYTITSQSRTVGSSIPCTSGITVHGSP